MMGEREKNAGGRRRTVRKRCCAHKGMSFWSSTFLLLQLHLFLPPSEQPWEEFTAGVYTKKTERGAAVKVETRIVSEAAAPQLAIFAAVRVVTLHLSVDPPP